MAGCQLLVGIERVHKDGDDTVDASGDAAVSAEAGKDPCEHAGVPAPPASEDESGEEPPFYLAVRTLDWNLTTRGLDLDGVCTCESRPGTYRNGIASCKGKAPSCDVDRGIDNQAVRVIESIVDAGADPSRIANDDVANGRRGVLFYVVGYNGKKNDRSVRVGAMLTYGITDPRGCTGSTPSFERRYRPAWCGADRWTFASGFVKPSTKEPGIEGAGYVRDGVLVVRFSATMPVFFGSAEMRVGAPILTGALQKNASGIWALEATLAGRLAAGEWLAAVGRLPIAGRPDAGLCAAAVFDQLKTEVCNGRDIASAPELDLTDGPCEAVSCGIALRAEQAAIGDETTDPPGSICSPGSVATGRYACP